MKVNVDYVAVLVFFPFSKVWRNTTVTWQEETTRWDSISIITFPIFFSLSPKYLTSLSPLLNRRQALLLHLRRRPVAPSFQSPSLSSQSAFCPHPLTVFATAPPASGPAECLSGLWWTHAPLLHAHSKQSLCQTDARKKNKTKKTFYVWQNVTSRHSRQVINKALVSIISFWLCAWAYRVTVNDPDTVESVTLTDAQQEK